MKFHILFVSLLATSIHGQNYIDINTDTIIDFRASDYVTDFTSMWNIQSDPTKIIEIGIQAYSIQDCYQCGCDYLLINQINKYTPKLCGENTTPDIRRVPEGDVKIIFVSDYTIVANGFYITIRYISKSVLSSTTTENLIPINDTTLESGNSSTVPPYITVIHGGFINGECTNQIVDVYYDTYIYLITAVIPMNGYCGVHVHRIPDKVALVTVTSSEASCSNSYLMINGHTVCGRTHINQYITSGIAMFVAMEHLFGREMNISIIYEDEIRDTTASTTTDTITTATSTTTIMPVSTTTDSRPIVQGCHAPMLLSEDYTIIITNNTYTNGMDCMWTMQNRPDYKILVTVDQFDIEPCGPRDHDYLSIYSVKLCGRGGGYSRYFYNTEVFIEFYTNSAVTYNGFIVNITYECISTPCTTTTTTPVPMTTTDQSYTPCNTEITTSTVIKALYGFNQRCSWILMPDTNYDNIHVSINHRFESSTACIDRLLFINENGIILKRLCGFGLYEEYYTNLREILFVSDYSISYRDFTIKITYLNRVSNSTREISTVTETTTTTPTTTTTTPTTTTTTPTTTTTTTTTTTPTTTTMSPTTTMTNATPEGCNDNEKIFNGNNGSLSINILQYLDNMNCRWTAKQVQGYYILIRFTDFEVENNNYCSYDYFSVNGNKYCGFISEHVEYKYYSQDVVMIFHSDNSVTAAGITVQVMYVRTTDAGGPALTTRRFV